MFPGRGPHQRRTPQAPGFVALRHNLVGTGDSLYILPASTSNQPSTNAPATTSTKEDQGRWIRPEKRWVKDSRAHAMQGEQSRNRDAYKEWKTTEQMTKKAAKDLQRREEDEKKKLEEEDLAALIRGIPLVPGVQSRALESARKINNFGGMKYPEGFNPPSAGLNMGQGRYT